MNRKDEKTLVVGLEHFIDKIGYQVFAYNHFKHPVKYLVSDNSGYSSEKAEKFLADIIILPQQKIKRFIYSLKYIMSSEFSQIEFYKTGKTIPLLVLFSLFFTRKKVFYILRGYEFDSNGFWDSLFLFSLKLCNGVIAKEPKLLEETKKVVKESKILFLPNAIVPYNNPLLSFSERDIDVLFLNTPRMDRNPLFLIDVFSELLKERNLKIVMCGFSVLSNKANKINVDDQRMVLNRIKERGLSEKIQVLPFVDNSFDFHSRAKVFVLPGNYIFLNYSMLESMSCGTVPVITKGDGWNLVFKNGKNGLVTDLNIGEYKNAIEQALDESIWQEISRNAYNTVINDYSIVSWGKKLLLFKGILHNDE